VLSTLHTNDALGVVPRLVDLKIQSYLIPSTLVLALAQRLVRRLCPDCKKMVEAKGFLKDKIIAEFNDIPVASRGEFSKLPEPVYIWEAQGCSKCKRQGFSGRIGIFETLEMTSELGEIVLKDLSENVLKAEGKRQGMMTMRQDGILKCLKGMTTIEEVLKATEEDITAAVDPSKK
jgi:type II secretory ATPase GspE/PulE/Tfp pilus assembly ATPase PilB-like protein